HLFARLALAVLALELVLELVLIPWWGYFGACAGTVVGELIFPAVGLWLCRRLAIGPLEWRPLARAAIAALVMAALAWPARDGSLLVLLPALFAAGVVYLFLCFWFGALHWEEVLYLYESLPQRLQRRRGSCAALRLPAPSVISSEGV